ncbi:MAG TPA: GntR family transcriptional regulator [Woeseiaceae bacterium]|nr:GntR family transcriptional regulator [Woeseiaceae bacterium]
MPTTRSRQGLAAVRKLRELVIGGCFKPGERLSELAAVELIGMSRTPVRAALQALAHEGLLEARSNGGFVVCDYSLADMLDAIELRGVLEGMAARLAAERSSGTAATRELHAILAQIDRLLDAAGVEGDDLYDAYVELNETFHAEMLRLAQSPMLERSLAQVTALPFASPSAFVKAGREQEVNRNVLIVAQYQHRAIAEAITAGDGVRALRLGQEHAQTAADSLKRLSRTGDVGRLVPGSTLLRRDTG